MGSIKEKIFILILITVFSFCLAAEVRADCGLYSDQASCETDFACEWCQMPSSISAHCFKKLEVNWPVSPAGTRLYRCSSLPDLVRYFYEWGLAIGGVLAFVALIFGGVLYLSSVGRPEGVKEARDRISSAILGLILLFGCWLILNTINPDLTTFRSEPVNLSLIPAYECDTDQDCQKTYGTNYECNDAAKGDGTPQGMCIQKEPKEDKYYPHAVVFSEVNFKGSTAILWEENGKNQKDMYAKSVITFFKTTNYTVIQLSQLVQKIAMALTLIMQTAVSVKLKETVMHDSTVICPVIGMMRPIFATQNAQTRTPVDILYNYSLTAAVSIK